MNDRNLAIRGIQDSDIDKLAFLRFGSEIQDIHDFNVKVFLCARNIGTDEYVITVRRTFKDLYGKISGGKILRLPVHRGIIARIKKLYEKVYGKSSDKIPNVEKIYRIVKEFGDNIYMPEWVNEEEYLNGKANVKEILTIQKQKGINAVTVSEVEDCVKKEKRRRKGEEKIMENAEFRIVEGGLGNLMGMVILSVISTSVGAYIMYRLLDESPYVADVLHEIGAKEWGIGLDTIAALIAFILLDVDDMIDAYNVVKGNEGGEGGSLVKAIMMCVLGGAFMGLTIHGLTHGSLYAIMPDDVVGYLASKIMPGSEWFFNDILMPIISCVVQMIVTGGPVGFIVTSICLLYTSPSPRDRG